MKRTVYANAQLSALLSASFSLVLFYWRGALEVIPGCTKVFFLSLAIHAEKKAAAKLAKVGELLSARRNEVISFLENLTANCYCLLHEF